MIIRLERGDELRNSATLGNSPQEKAMKQQMKLLALEFLDVTSHVATIPESMSTSDIVVRQLYGLLPSQEPQNSSSVNMNTPAIPDKQFQNIISLQTLFIFIIILVLLYLYFKRLIYVGPLVEEN
jgi:hypothetical protein